MSQRTINIPILLYHDIVSTGSRTCAYALTATAFDRQLRHMHARGGPTKTVDETYDQTVRGTFVTNPASFMITFDDCYRCFADSVLNTLKEIGLKASFFITTGCIGRSSGHLRVSDIRSLASTGMSIQSHTHSHPFLDELTPALIRRELETSKGKIEDIIRKPVSFFSCPGGRYNQSVIDIARKIGYKGVFTSRPGFSHIFRDDFMIFRRFNIHSGFTEAQLTDLLDQNRFREHTLELRYMIKQTIRRLMGNHVYHQIWKMSQKTDRDE